MLFTKNKLCLSTVVTTGVVTTLKSLFVSGAGRGDPPTPPFCSASWG